MCISNIIHLFKYIFRGTMTTAILNIAKSISQRFEDLKGTAPYKRACEVVEFSTLIALPVAVPGVLMCLAAAH